MGEMAEIADAATLSLWLGPGHAGSLKRDRAFDGSRHDVSMIAVWNFGPGGKIAILTIRPR